MTSMLCCLADAVNSGVCFSDWSGRALKDDIKVDCLHLSIFSFLVLLVGSFILFQSFQLYSPGIVSNSYPLV